MPQTWLIVGGSRGIGLEFVTQLLAQGHTVIATARAPASAPPVNSLGNGSQLYSLTGTPNGKNLTILECDVSDDASIKRFGEQVRKLGRKGAVLERGIIDVVVLNAGVLVYPNRVSEISFKDFAHHLHTNTIGPLITAQTLLALSSPTYLPPVSVLTSPISPNFPSTPLSIHTLVFISSDSGSTTNFRSFEDGFAAYAASKAALNQGLRHLAAELQRSKGRAAPTVLALHPGEVTTDMAASVSLDWDVEGIISPGESISCMLKVIAEKGKGGIDEGGHASAAGKQEEGVATFWTWEGRRYPW
ncbi:putative oxidoreductase [Hyphodiscus hymeniophilus]|uniref:Oxidoreductase n=1 Tax=Hyphodiscus hymeniophilus TaxID=353542 RepID=A0A9P6VJA5_9HELO|nr:putative oxidoreductase [Hyphodiscus hymeniophilus]